MNRLAQILMAIVTGLVGAAVLHIVIILALPHFTGKDAYTRVRAEGAANRFHLLDDSPDRIGLSNLDPFVKTAVCHFDTTERAARLVSPANAGFWSLAIYDRSSNEVFSMNDRTSLDGVLDVVVASPVQVARLRKAPPDGLASAIIVELPTQAGYAVLRTLAPQASLEAGAAAFLAEAGCVSLRID
ncbi:DUF1254 domain-containing protein [Ciceribacter sp. L1K22]|uniref:DUF1254 domain-containing protein n=1 Tax=Ciceribacter sp. L1K22 TaxID=2820275 RepID=UPI001ABEAFE8|nr:DUF1254 domain-containing protein [Ciceribacter sp. L1K22]MBO3759405.1 DUF1254 domain-containing protein [Ciceribacter sp. L1K22]